VIEMAEYTLYCFAESGNAYKAALMLELCGADWQPRRVDFFKGETRSSEFRSGLNAMGEVPVLEHDGRRLSQSGVILHYLAERLDRFGGASEEERREILRWILFDNHKFTSYAATYRFLLRFAKTGEPAVMAFLRTRVSGAYSVVEQHLAQRQFLVGERPTIADLSLVGYLFYRDELDLDWSAWPHLVRWTERVAALPRWKQPYDLMPRAFEPA
jgi:glutathione S-transferase